MTVLSPIYRDGRHYDLLYPAGEQLPRFWIDLAHEYGDPILEVTCGTGRISIPLAQAGFEVTGLDHSAVMLAEAKRKAHTVGTQVTWVQADMRDFALDKQFSLILLPANALCHLLHFSDLEACLACVKRHLRPDGRFVVKVFVPNLTYLLQSPEQREPFGEYHDPDSGEEIVVTHSSSYDAASQIKYNRLYYKVGAGGEQEAGVLDIRIYFPQELDALFKYNGFAVEHKFGDLDRCSFDAKSTDQVFILKLNSATG